MAIYDWDNDEDWPKQLPDAPDWRIGVALLIAFTAVTVLATYLL